MKRLLVIFSILIFPFITFGDLLPEPIDLMDDVGIIYSENVEEDEINTHPDISNTNNIENDINNNINGNDIINEDIEGKINDIESDINPDIIYQADLGDIYFGFCNNGVDTLTDSLNAAVEQGKPFPICLTFYNTNKEYPAYLDISLVFGVKGSDGSDVCGLESMDKFISSGNLGEIEIPADNYLIKELELIYPLGYDGEQKACIGVSSIDKNLKDDEGGLVVIARRVFKANFFVGSLDGIKNELTVKGLQANLDDNKDLILSFWVENTGNMENTFDIQGHVKGFFGYDKKFEIVSGQVAPSKSQYIEANLGSLPSYGGKFNIDFTINGTPFFSYDISNANIDPSWLEPKSWDFGTTYFKMPWLILAVVVIFILLLIAMFRKPKQKVIYVQQPSTPQPQQPGQQPVQQVTQPQQTVQSVQQPVNPQNPNQPIQQ